MDRTPAHCATAMDGAVAEGDMWPRLPEIRVPTLMLSRAKSPIAQEAEVKAMQSRMPAAKLVAFEGYGHVVNMLAPERCVAEVRKFLAEQPAGLASGASR
jgi:pimeloyl-ACP methyl ester carboxylesterase